MTNALYRVLYNTILKLHLKLHTRNTRLHSKNFIKIGHINSNENIQIIRLLKITIIMGNAWAWKSMVEQQIKSLRNFGYNSIPVKLQTWHNNAAFIMFCT